MSMAQRRSGTIDPVHQSDSGSTLTTVPRMKNRIVGSVDQTYDPTENETAMAS